MKRVLTTDDDDDDDVVYVKTSLNESLRPEKVKLASPLGTRTELAERSSVEKKLMQGSEMVSFSRTNVALQEARPVLVIKNTFNERGQRTPAARADDSAAEDLSMECNEEPSYTTAAFRETVGSPRETLHSKAQSTLTDASVIAPRQPLLVESRSPRKRSDCAIIRDFIDKQHNVLFPLHNAPKPNASLRVIRLSATANRSSEPEIRVPDFGLNAPCSNGTSLVHKRLGNASCYQCTLCPYTESLPSEVARHIKERHPSMSDIQVKRPHIFIFCRHCDFVGLDKLSVWYHFANYHGLNSTISVKRPEECTSPPFQPHQLQTEQIVFRCDVCNFLSISPHDVMRHAVKQHSEHSKMGKCIKRGFVQMSRLDASNEPPRQNSGSDTDTYKVWLMSAYFVCTQCNCITQSRTLMWLHCISRHSNTFLLLICSVCGQCSHDLTWISQHLPQVHAMDELKACSVTVVRNDTTVVEQLCKPGIRAIHATTPPGVQNNVSCLLDCGRSQRDITQFPTGTTSPQALSSALSRQTVSKPIAVGPCLCRNTVSGNKMKRAVSILKSVIAPSLPEKGIRQESSDTSTEDMSTDTHPTQSPSVQQPQSCQQIQKPLQQMPQSKPVQLVQLSKPVQSILQPKPVQSIQQSKPVQPVQQPKPVQSVQQLNPVQSIQQSKPVQSVQQQQYPTHGTRLPATITNDDRINDASSKGQVEPRQTRSDVHLLNSATSSQLVELAQEVRYAQLPDGSVQLDIVWYYE